MPHKGKGSYKGAKRKIGIGDLKKSKVASGSVKQKSTRKGMT